GAGLRGRGRAKPVQINIGAVATDVRLDAELGALAADEHVEARERALAVRDAALLADHPYVVAEALDADVADRRARAGADLHGGNGEPPWPATLRRQLFHHRHAGAR